MSSRDLAIEGVIGRPDNLLWVNPNEVDIVPGENPRDEDLALDDLLPLLEADGFRIDRAISVYKDDDNRLKLLDGQRRLLCAQHLNLPRIPAILVKGMADPMARLLAMLAANRNKHLTPGEEGRAYLRLKNNGLTIKQIADTVRYSESHVRARLDYLDAKPEIVAAHRTGAIGVTDAVEVVRMAARKKIPQAVALTQVKGQKAMPKVKTPSIPKEDANAEVTLRHLLLHMDRETVFAVFFDVFPKGEIERFIFHDALA